jgi:hypothetical protein
MNELRRIGIKFYCREGGDVSLLELIPIFHRWIQQRSTDTTLIDVADYSHVTHGPGVLLVAHEGNYGLDESGGRRGLVYYQKVSEDSDLAGVVARIARRALAACKRLESEPELEGRLRFDAGAFELFSNDRLLGPNDEQTYRELAPQVEALASMLHGSGGARIDKQSDPRERLTFFVGGAKSVDAAAALGRLEA